MRVLLLVGDKTVNWKIRNLNFENINSIDIEFISEIFTTNNIFYNQCQSISRYIRESKPTSLRSEIYFTYNLSKNLFKSYSFRIKLLTILCGKYRIRNFYTFKQFVKYFLKLKTLALILVCIYGLLKFPENLLLRVLKFSYSDHEIFSNFIQQMNPDVIVLFSGGYDNFNFVIDFCSKNPKIKYVFVMNNWDNPSSKSFVSKNFDLVCLWNEEQIDQIKRIIGIDGHKLSVLGSNTADLAYSKYLKYTPQKKISNGALLFVGQQNAFDELSEVLKIQKLINDEKTSFSSLHYRPHPISGRQIKRLSLKTPFALDIQIDDSRDLDLRLYDGIICLPTTLILEVILSKTPFVIYVPKNANYRLDPRTMWNYTHFDNLKTLNPARVVKTFDDLIPILKEGIPLPNNIDHFKFNRVFPLYSEEYSARLLKILKQTS